MGSNFNFKGFGNDSTPMDEVGGYQSPSNLTLARQQSIYTLTFEELQNTIGSGLGKDFGSMNMDELLKNIYSAEETQTMAASGSSLVAGAPPPEGLQRQGSLTLPRTLSLRTVEDVWNDISKGLLGGSSLPAVEIGDAAGPATAQRQQTLGEITLEEFLVRAGVVRDDTSTAVGLSGGTAGGYFGNGGIDFGQETKTGLPSRATLAASTPIPARINGGATNHEQPQLQARPSPQLMPKQGAIRCATPFQSNSNYKRRAMEIGNQGTPTDYIHQIPSDETAKPNGITSSMSPIAYDCDDGFRRRRVGGKVEKVAERRQRRMIKNRESAARSRARKQAYTIELEAEVAKLKEENEELKKKEAELEQLQKHQATENLLQGGKKRSLRRTYTGPW